MLFDPKDLDLGATLPESAERMIEYKDISEWEEECFDIIENYNEISIDVSSNPQEKIESIPESSKVNQN